LALERIEVCLLEGGFRDVGVVVLVAAAAAAAVVGFGAATNGVSFVFGLVVAESGLGLA
jgi:hypothetical protein